MSAKKQKDAGRIKEERTGASTSRRDKKDPRRISRRGECWIDAFSITNPQTTLA